MPSRQLVALRGVPTGRGEVEFIVALFQRHTVMPAAVGDVAHETGTFVSIPDVDLDVWDGLSVRHGSRDGEGGALGSNRALAQ
jgi:hypothetical protein